MAAVEIHRWTSREYELLASRHFFRPEDHVELIDGLIYKRPPLSSRHATALQLSAEVFRDRFPIGAGFEIRMLFPLVLGNDSEPEPDIAIVPGSIRDYADHHPTTALLLMEIADSSLFHDRKRKIPLYARSGIPESWLLNLTRRTLEVYREPSSEGYRSRTVLRADDSVSPLSRPEGSIRVAELLP